MATINHHDNQTSMPSESSNGIPYGNQKVPSTFHSIESLMTPYGHSYPSDQWGGMRQSSYGPYSRLPHVDKADSYPRSVWPHSPSIPFDNKSALQQHLFPSCNNDAFAETPGCNGSNKFPYQPSVSDLSVNPFQDPSEAYYIKNGLCRQESHEFSPVAIPASSANDDILDVGSFSPFGSPTDSHDANRTNSGPCSTSSTGYSSGYQSCGGSTDNSPYRSLSADHPLPDSHQRPEDRYQPDVFLTEQTTFPPCSAAEMSPENSTPTAPSSDLSLMPSILRGNLASDQSVDLPCPSTTNVESPLPMAPVTSAPQAPSTASTVDGTQTKKCRVKYTSAQLDILEKAFNDTPYPDWDEMEELSKRLDVAEQKIKVWFQNKRARWRKKQNAQQLQDVSAFKPLAQMSALYRFPSSVPNFQSTQKTSGIYPANTPAPHTSQLSFPGQHYPTHPSYGTHPSITTSAMSEQPQANQFGYPMKHPAATYQNQRVSTATGQSPACYPSPMMYNSASRLPRFPQPNHGNYGHMSNNFMYPYM